jgi:AcrR family transcriptional regulator
MPESHDQRQARRARERDHIEEVAARLFAEQGYAETTVDQIVAAARISKPALYRHFPSKRDLHLALLRRHQTALAATALAELGPERSLDRLPDMLDAWFRHVQEHPFVWRLLFHDATGDPDVQAVHAQIRDAQRAADVALLREFAPDIPEAEREPLGEVIRSSLTGLAVWWLDHPDVPRARLVAVMLRLTRGLVTTAPGSRTA